jgi:hypothetical protein
VPQISQSHQEVLSIVLLYLQRMLGKVYLYAYLCGHTICKFGSKHNLARGT